MGLKTESVRAPGGEKLGLPTKRKPPGDRMRADLPQLSSQKPERVPKIPSHRTDYTLLPRERGSQVGLEFSDGEKAEPWRQHRPHSRSVNLLPPQLLFRLPFGVGLAASTEARKVPLTFGYRPTSGDSHRRSYLSLEFSQGTMSRSLGCGNHDLLQILPALLRGKRRREQAQQLLFTSTASCRGYIMSSGNHQGQLAH